jgi:two-component system sensor histidine kinase HydH
MSRPEPVEASLSSLKFSDYVTHELANPLNGMLVSVEIVEKYFAANPRAMDEIGDVLAILKKEIQRLFLLLEELRCSGALFEIRLQPTSLAAEVRELLALESAYYGQCRIRVNQEIPSDLPRIMADKDKLRQVLLNLCKNAVEAMPNGGTLTLRGYAIYGWVCLDIADTGDGIPQAMLVFEPVVTNKPQSNGLGLAIVREIVKQHKGTVSYSTRLGKGTTFHLKFPIPAG